MLEFIKGIAFFLFLCFISALAATAVHATTVRYTFTDVGLVAYNAYWKATATPWAKVTPVPFSGLSMPTPGIWQGEIDIGNVAPGTALEAAVTAYDGVRESALSNVCSLVVPTWTITPSPTMTVTATYTRTATSTITSTFTPTFTPTNTPSNTPTNTRTATVTATRTNTPTATWTPVPVPTLLNCDFNGDGRISMGEKIRCLFKGFFG